MIYGSGDAILKKVGTSGLYIGLLWHLLGGWVGGRVGGRVG
jgi:hypothetical protein